MPTSARPVSGFRAACRPLCFAVVILALSVAASMTRLAPWPVSHAVPTSYVVWGESASPVATTHLQPHHEAIPDAKTVGSETRLPGLGSGTILTTLVVIAACLACLVLALVWRPPLSRRRQPRDPAAVSQEGARGSEMEKLRPEASCLPTADVTAAGELIQRAWRTLERAGAGARVARDSVETPREYAGRLARSLAISEPDLARLQELYSSVTYGRWTPSEEEIERTRDLVSGLVTEVIARDTT